MRRLGRSIHVLFFILYPPLFLYSYNIKEAAFQDVLNALLVIIAAFTIFAVIEYTLLFKRDIEKSALAVSISLMIFFTYGHIYTLLKPLWWHLFGITSHTKLGLLLLVVWGLVGLGSHFILYRSKGDLKDVSNTFNVISGSLLILVLVNIIVTTGKTAHSAIYGTLIDPVYQEVEPSSAQVKSELPDIYYIIPDRYSNNEMLESVYGFDNSQFTEFLESKGFYVAYSSACNYDTTPLSIVSSLNYQYLNVEATLDFDPEANNRIKPNIQASRTHRFLRSQGYQLIHSGSWANLTRENEFADYNLMTSDLSEFSSILISTTILKPFIGFFDLRWHPARAQWLRSNKRFEMLEEVVDMPGPKFVFAHFLTPHPPFVFDVDGRYIPLSERVKTPINDGYIKLLQYTNSRLEVFVESILSRSEIPPVIIIQSDEGPNRITEFSVTDSTDVLRAEKMILSSYYLPGVETDSILYDSISPVNSFRIVFNEYFGTSYEMLADTTIVFD